jgi:hypothetical protein
MSRGDYRGLRWLPALLAAALPIGVAAQESLLFFQTPGRPRDPLADRGDLTGQVCDDLDGDRRCTSADDPVSGLTVALDSGPYALTDEQGRYHLREMRPGQVLVKLDLGALTTGSTAPGGDRQVVEVPRGGIMVVDFPVRLVREQVRIGRAERYGFKLFPQARELPVSVVGNINDVKALANGVAVKLPTVDAEMGDLRQGTFARAGQAQTFKLRSSYAVAGPASWELGIYDSQRQQIQVFSGKGTPPKTIAWDGADKGKVPLAGDRSYSYRACMQFADGEEACSPYRAFGLIGPGGRRPKVVRPDVEAQAVLNGEKAPLDRDGSFLRGVPPDEKRRVKLALTKNDGRTASATLHMPSLRIAQPAEPMGVEWGADRPEFSASAKGDRLVVHLTGATSSENRLAVGDKRTTIGKDGAFAQDITVPKGRTRVELTVTAPGGVNSIYELTLLLADRDPQGQPVIAIERIPDLEIGLPPEGSSVGLPHLLLRGKTTAGNQLTINGAQVALAADGAFSHLTPVAGRGQTLQVEVVDPEGHKGTITRTLGSAGAILPVVLGDASPGGTFGKEAQGGASFTDGMLLGGLGSSLHYRPAIARFTGMIGARPNAPRTLELPFLAGGEFTTGSRQVAFGFHVLGTFYQDFVVKDDPGTRDLAQRHLSLGPVLSATFPAGPVRFYLDAGYQMDQADAVDPRGETPEEIDSARARLRRRAQYWTVGLGLRHPLLSRVDLVGHVGAAGAVGAPAGVKATFPEKLDGYVGLLWRPSNLVGSSFFLRYGVDQDRGSFEPVPPAESDIQHMLLVASSFDLISGRPGLMRLSPGLAVQTHSEPNHGFFDFPSYHALVRADTRLLPKLNIGLEYRVEILQAAETGGGAHIQYILLESNYDLFRFFRLGIAGGYRHAPKDAEVVREQQVLGRLQFFY